MRKPRLIRRLAPLGILILFAAATAVGASLLAFSPQDEAGQEIRAGRAVAGRPPQEGQPMPQTPDWKEAEWKEVRRLISEQKMSAAEEKVEEILAAAREDGRTEDWTRALVRRTQLTMALHAYETAVEELAAARDPEAGGWPEDPEHRSILHLFYGESLRGYLQAYSWEIQQRERVASDEVPDLKAWTKEQIAAAAQESYLEVWKRRESWGERSIGAWSEYIQPNNYPAHIRGTLRDAVSYQWADLLGDTSLWQPEDSQEIYRLSLADLLSPAGPALSEEELASPDVHPLAKLAAVLGDLEEWHRKNDRPEAAFEARRVRDQRLHEAFSQEEDLAVIRDDLRRALNRLSERYEWWSMGRATLARLVQQKDAPDALVEALELAREGAEAHPGSIGGKHCRQIIASIENFAFEITSMASDGADRRSIAVNHKNLDQLHFRAYRFDLLERLKRADDYNLLPGYQDVPKLLAGREADARWTAELPATPDYRQHRTYVTPPLDEPGLYLIVASADADFRSEPTAATALNFILTDLVILSRVDEATADVTVRSGASGEPVSGARVGLYRYDWQKGHREVASRTTGEGGRALFEGALEQGKSYFVLAQAGGDTALYAQGLNREYDRREQEQQASLLFTDRSVYRPGQEVQWKVVTYEGKGDEADYRITADRAVTVTLVDANGEVVAEEEVKTNDHGSASGTFPIPRGRLLGGWRLSTSLGAGAPIRVEEYKRPTFEVEIDDPEEALRLNRPATLQGSVKYYFGLPVTTGSVRWRVTREPMYPPWWSWWGRPTQSSRVIDSGTTELTEDGTFTVTFTPEADEREAPEVEAGGGGAGVTGRAGIIRPLGPGVSYRYRLAVEVTDEGGETREASRAFRLGFVAVAAAIEQERGFLPAGEPQEIRIRRTDLDGAAQPGEGRWRLVRLVEPAETPLPADLPPQGGAPIPFDDTPRGENAQASPPGEWSGEEPYRTSGDELRPRWDTGIETDAVLRTWESGAEAAAGRLEHGDDGWAAAGLPALEAGAYALIYETEDAFGASLTVRESFLVSRDGAEAPHLPAVLEVETTTAEVGDTVRLLAASGLPNQELRLEIFRTDREPEVRTFRSDGGVRVLEIPVTPKDRGGITFRLIALRDFQLMTPEVRVRVPWSDRRLDVELATFRDRLRPGDRETWTVKVKSSDPGGDPEAVGAGAAELLAYMYDRSLDLFASHDPVDPLSIYPERWPAEGLGSSLGATGPVWRSASGWPSVPAAPNLTDDRLKFFDGYGIGGPGRRMRGGLVTRSMAYDEARPEMAMSAAPPPPAPAAMEADAAMNKQSVTVTSGSPLLEESLEADGGGDAGAPPEVRENFAETAFWEPHLLTGSDGSVSFEFTVPDSVTEWNVWVHAMTKDLRYGRANEQVATVKELLVRPYLPRFLREGDRAELRVVVNNSGEEPLSGTLSFELFDPATDESLAAEFGLDGSERSFAVKPGGGETLTFPVTVPPRVGTVAFRAVGRAQSSGGALSDGELRPLPVLPGRYHLAQSRFAALEDEARRELTFEDMREDDPTRIHDQLVVTIDGQLFYGVLDALPYLVEYPYECTEQTLNRFLSTGIVTSVFDRYPEVAKMAEQLSERETVLEAWDEPDPNREMLLVETPWLTAAAGGKAPEGTEILNVLDPARAAAVRRESLAELRRAQTSAGGFPWWPGGPPSPYMTLYIVHGFSRGLEHDVEVPQDVVVRAWGYLHRHYVDELAGRLVRDEAGWELITFLNYVLSSYPDESWTGGVFTAEERADMLDFSFRHWKEHSPLLKGYLALTLHRAGRSDDAGLVFDSIMDSARTDPDLGTYWAPEDRAWLWYNDTIESHAFTLRAMTELAPDDPRRQGLVHWLFLNKKLNHWKSTRATAEVIYALVHYLEDEGTLGAREEIRVAVGPATKTFTFEPDRYTGKKNQLVVPGEELDPATQSTVVVEKDTPGLAFASATWHFSTERLPPEARGDFFSVERSFFRRELRGDEWVLTPLTGGEEIAVGDEVEVRLSIRSKHAAEYVHLRSPRGAGFEPTELTSGYRWDLGLGWYQETRDSGSSFFFDWLPAGEYTLKTRWRAALAGAFKVGPATLQSMYAPEFNAYSSGALLEVRGEAAPEP